MSKFDSLMESHLNSTNLVRIRIKHDPRNEAGEIGDYVGYVLEEDGMGNIIALVPSMGGETMELGPDDFGPDCGDMTGDSLTAFKKHVVDYLMTRGYHDEVSKHMEVILNATDVTQLEQVLKDCGCDMMSIVNMYRDYAQNEEF